MQWSLWKNQKDKPNKQEIVTICLKKREVKLSSISCFLAACTCVGNGMSWMSLSCHCILQCGHLPADVMLPFLRPSAPGKAAEGPREIQWEHVGRLQESAHACSLRLHNVSYVIRTEADPWEVKTVASRNRLKKMVALSQATGKGMIASLGSDKSESVWSVPWLYATSWGILTNMLGELTNLLLVWPLVLNGRKEKKKAGSEGQWKE